MRAEGHQVGNHTYDHTRLLEAEPEEVVEEIHKTEVLLTELLGEGDYWLRPPYGAIDETRSALVETPMSYWTVDPEDWKLLDAAKVAETPRSSRPSRRTLVVSRRGPSSKVRATYLGPSTSPSRVSSSSSPNISSGISAPPPALTALPPPQAVSSRIAKKIGPYRASPLFMLLHLKG